MALWRSHCQARIGLQRPIPTKFCCFLWHVVQGRVRDKGEYFITQGGGGNHLKGGITREAVSPLASQGNIWLQFALTGLKGSQDPPEIHYQHSCRFADVLKMIETLHQCPMQTNHGGPLLCSIKPCRRRVGDKGRGMVAEAVLGSWVFFLPLSPGRSRRSTFGRCCAGPLRRRSPAPRFRRCLPAAPLREFVIGRVLGPFAPAFAGSLLYECSCRSDRATQDCSMALRVRKGRKGQARRERKSDSWTGRTRCSRSRRCLGGTAEDSTSRY